MPFPRDYIQGLDRQCTDFEEGWRSYLCGQWKKGGWWYYHLFGLAIKTPIGTMTTFLLAVALSIGSICRGRTTGWRDEAFLLAPGIAILILVSSEVGFSKHVRYVIPALPFIIIWTAKAVNCVGPILGKLAWAGVGRNCNQ